MTPQIQEIIRKAEHDTWDKMNNFGTLKDAIAFSKVNFLKERIANLAIMECIKICEQNGDIKSKEMIQGLLNLTKNTE